MILSSAHYRAGKVEKAMKAKTINPLYSDDAIERFRSAIGYVKQEETVSQRSMEWVDLRCRVCGELSGRIEHRWVVADSDGNAIEVDGDDLYPCAACAHGLADALTVSR